MSETSEKVHSRLEAGLNFINEIKQTTGFKLQNDEDVFFLRIWGELQGRIKDMSLPASDRKNYSKIQNHIGDLHSCLSSLFYHIDNVERLEKKLNILIEKYQKSTPCASGGSYNPSLTSRFTFEYHAFAFASVRCVNHVFPVLGYICFRNYCPGKPSFQKKSEGKRTEILDSINVILNKYSKLENLFKKGNQKSIRDLIAHDQFLHTGSLHIDEKQAKLIGILPLDISHFNEQLEPNVYYLSQIMLNQAKQIKEFIMEIITTIIEPYLDMPDNA